MRRLALVLSLLVLASGCSDGGGSDESVTGAEGGAVPNLVVIDGDFDYWSVSKAVVTGQPTPDSTSIEVIGHTARCREYGPVGYALDESRSTVEITLVVGESGTCEDVALPAMLTVPLEAPLGSRRIVLVEPVRP